MSLYNHLRTNENICFPCRKGRQHLFMSTFVFCGICIHAENSGIREAFLQQRFYLLRSCLKSSNIRRAAGRTGFYLWYLIAAVMTNHLSVSVSSKRNITMGTFHYITARPATDKACISSPVEE